MSEVNVISIKKRKSSRNHQYLILKTCSNDQKIETFLAFSFNIVAKITTQVDAWNENNENDRKLIIIAEGDDTYPRKITSVTTASDMLWHIPPVTVSSRRNSAEEILM